MIQGGTHSHPRTQESPGGRTVQDTKTRLSSTDGKKSNGGDRKSLQGKLHTSGKLLLSCIVI